MNTSNILFIVGGTFTQLEDIIHRRVGHLGIGFQSDEEEEVSTQENILHRVESGDLVQFGLIPEFVGRLPVVGILDDLKEDDFVRILTEPKNAIVRQYQKLFRLDDCEIEFTEEALRVIAQRATCAMACSSATCRTRRSVATTSSATATECSSSRAPRT